MSTLVMHLFPTHRARLAALTTLMTGLAALCPARTTAQGVYMRRDADGKVTFSNAPTGTGFQSSPELSRSARPVVTKKKIHESMTPTSAHSPLQLMDQLSDRIRKIEAETEASIELSHERGASAALEDRFVSFRRTGVRSAAAHF